MSAHPLLRGPAPAQYFHPFFQFFRFSPSTSGEGDQNLLPPTLKNGGVGGGGGSELWCFILIPLFQFRKTFSDVFRESRKGALVWNWLNIDWVSKTLFQQTREWLNDWLLGLWIHRWQEVSAKILNLTFFQKDFTTAKPGTISVYI